MNIFSKTLALKHETLKANLLILLLMLPSRFSAKLTWLNAVINGHSLKEEDYKVFETSGETRPDSLRKKRTRQ